MTRQPSEQGTPLPAAADPWADFLAPEGDEDDPGEPPPEPPSRPVEQPRPPPASVVELGAPPDDTVGAAKWAYMLHMRLADEARLDKNMTPSQRRKEVRSILAGAAKHMMDALRYDVLKIIQKENEQLDAKKRGAPTGKSESRPSPPDTAKVIPLRRG